MQALQWLNRYTNLFVEAILGTFGRDTFIGIFFLTLFGIIFGGLGVYGVISDYFHTGSILEMILAITVFATFFFYFLYVLLRAGFGIWNDFFNEGDLPKD